MELNLEKYTSEEILSTYQFIFSQYLSGCLSTPEELEHVPTVYVFAETCKELRKQYLNRKDTKFSDITELEQNLMIAICQYGQITEDRLKPFLTININ